MKVVNVTAPIHLKGDQMEGLQSLSNGMIATIIGVVVGLIGMFLYELDDIIRGDE